jgi:polyvinyl alcohol dehydrogenase (cytochrome)
VSRFTRALIACACALCTLACATPAIASAGDVTSWGGNPQGWRTDSAEHAISPANVKRLRLKWAFAIPGVTGQQSEPAVVGSTLYVGATNGIFYALDAQTGKLRWKFDTRTVQAPGATGNQLRDGPAVADGIVYFGDKKANVYALSARSGRMLWHTKADAHPYAAMTGAPVIWHGRVLIGVSSIEELAAGVPAYPCCTFRGSLVALDAHTGRLLWRYWTLPSAPVQVGLSASVPPVPQYAPSGDAVWTSPAIDPRTGIAYIGTGNTYTGDSPLEDAIIAVNAATGKQVWVHQLTNADDWNLSCVYSPGLTNCPRPGADFDFGSSPNLFTIGSETVVGEGQKSGVYHVLDARTGKIVWQTMLSRASGLSQAAGLQGIEWGTSYDGTHVYVATNVATPGQMFALSPKTGKVVWHTPVPLGICATGGAAHYLHLTPIECLPALPSAVSSTPGLVWEGGQDGRLRAYSSSTGRVLWQYDTVRTYFHTSDHVLGHGGSIDGGGTVVSHGVVYTNSGYTHFGIIGSEMAGNMLLAFSLPAR